MPPTPITSPTDLQALIARARAVRDLHEYDVPPSLQKEAGSIVRLRFVELTVDEELIAARRAGADPIMLAWELAKDSFRGIVRARLVPAVDAGADDTVAFDSVTLGSGDGSMDAVWREMHPKLRQLVVTAYNSIHTAKEDESKAFLQSGRVIAG